MTRPTFLTKTYDMDRQLTERSKAEKRLFAAYWVPLVGFLISMVGLIVLFGWLAGYDSVTRLSSGLASMKPNTALSFVYLGAALGLNSKFFPAFKFRTLQIGLCFGAFVLSFASLILHFAFPSPILDFSVIDISTSSDPSARMSEMTAVSFVLATMALGLLLFYRQRMSAIAGGLSLGVLLISVFALAAYALDARALYALRPFESMALHTSLLFFLLSIGVLGVVFAANYYVVPRFNSALVRNAFAIWGLVIAFEYISGRLIVQVSDELPGAFLTLLNARSLLTIIISAALIFSVAALISIKDQREKELDARLQENRALLQSVMNSAAEGIYGIDSEGNCNFVNQSCLEQLGYGSRSELLGKKMHGLVHHTHDDGTPFPLEECPIYQSLSSSQRIHVDDDVFWRKDGTKMPVEYWSYPLLRDGVITGSVVTFVNIAERKKAQETRLLLMREVNHRANNLLAVVQSIARQTARQKSGEEFSESLGQRLQSLAGSQDLIIKGDWHSVTLNALVTKQFAILGKNHKDHMNARGPEVLLTPQAAQALGMAFHELATNSIKYGALSRDCGKVDVAWRRKRKNGIEVLEVQWQEKNGPPVTKPDYTGFGSVVIERLAAATVDGTVELDYKPEGLIWHMTCPAKSALAPTSSYGRATEGSDG